MELESNLFRENQVIVINLLLKSQYFLNKEGEMINNIRNSTRCYRTVRIYTGTEFGVINSGILT
jgi:hypothetical protein